MFGMDSPIAIGFASLQRADSWLELPEDLVTADGATDWVAHEGDGAALAPSMTQSHAMSLSPLPPVVDDGCGRFAGEVWDSLHATATPSEMASASPSVDKPSVDQMLYRALHEPVVDSMQVLASDPDAVTSLALQLTKTQSAVDAFNVIPLCERLGVVRLHGRSFSMAHPARSATLVLQCLPPSVTALDVSAPSLHESAVEGFVQGLESSAPGLHALRLAGVSVARMEEMCGFAERVLVRAPGLVRLELPGTDLSGTSETALDGLRSLTGAMTQLTSLAVLDLSGNDLGNNGALTLAHALAGSSGAAGIEAVPPRSASESESESKSGAEAEDDEEQAQGETQAADATGISEADAAATVAHASEDAIMAAEQELRPTASAGLDDDWRPGARGGGLLASLRCLVLEGVTRGDALGSLYLARALQCGSRLVALSLAGCSFGAGAGVPASALAGAVKSHAASLKSLDLRRCRLWTGGGVQLARGLVGAHRMLSLNLAGNDLGGQAAEACGELAEALMGMPRLRDLDLSENHLHNDGLELLAPALVSRPHLQTLGLTMNRLTGEACRALHRAASAHKAPTWASLQSLRLGSNPLRSAGIVWLSSGLLQGCRTLHFLGLDGCRLRAHDIVRLAQGLPGMESATAAGAVAPVAAIASAGARPSGSAATASEANERALRAPGPTANRSASAEGGAKADPMPTVGAARSLSTPDSHAGAPPLRGGLLVSASTVTGTTPEHVPTLRSLDIHDNLLSGHTGGRALQALLASRGCDVLGMCDVRACGLDNEAATSFASSLGAIAWKAKFMRLDARNNAELNTLPSGLACLRELSVDHTTVVSPVIAEGQDGADALRAAHDDSDESDDEDDDEDGEEEEQSGRESDDHESEADDVAFVDSAAST